MSEDLKANVSEIMEFTAQTWKGIAVSAGYIAGLFDEIKSDEAVPMADIARRKGYDVEKLKKWFGFAAGMGIVALDGGSVRLTEKGALYGLSSPIKDVLAFLQMTEFFLKAGAEAANTFKPGNSYDKLSDGKISKYYQPKVSDNLSASLHEHFKRLQVRDGELFLDVGCGNGSFLRALNTFMPGLRLAGVDMNLFAIEKAKKENLALGLGDRIKMLVGDVTEDIADFPDGSYDWVSAINLLYFIPYDKRESLIENMVRIARKGVFMNWVVADNSLINATGNPLLSLLWNDFAGFFSQSEADERMEALKWRYRDKKILTDTIVQGNSILISILSQ